MRIIDFNDFPQDERGSFKRCCRIESRGHYNDFCVRAEEIELPIASVDAVPSVRRSVVVIHVPTGRGRRYEENNAQYWIAKFSDDMSDAYFMDYEAIAYGKSQAVPARPTPRLILPERSRARAPATA